MNDQTLTPDSDNTHLSLPLNEKAVERLSYSAPTLKVLATDSTQFLLGPDVDSATGSQIP